MLFSGRIHCDWYCLEFLVTHWQEQRDQHEGNISVISTFPPWWDLRWVLPLHYLAKPLPSPRPFSSRTQMSVHLPQNREPYIPLLSAWRVASNSPLTSGLQLHYLVHWQLAETKAPLPYTPSFLLLLFLTLKSSWTVITATRFHVKNVETDDG